MTILMKANLVVAAIAVVCSSTVSAATVTIQNEAFEVTVPAAWTSRKIVQADPDEAMKTGEFSFSVSTEPGAPEPKDWNGIEFNNSGGSADVPPPVVVVYAHRKDGQTPEEFAQMLEATVKMWGGKILEVSKTKDSLDYTYDLFTKNRFVVRFDKGRRIVLHYLVPSLDKTLFDKYAPEVDAVVQSIKVR